MTSPELAPPDLVYRIARRCLVGGFVTCLTLVVIALVVSVVTGDAISSDTLPLQDLPAAVMDGDPGAIAELAIFAMILTPIATTIGIIVGFLALGDRRFAGISALVLLVLTTSMVVALLR